MRGRFLLRRVGKNVDDRIQKHHEGLAADYTTRRLPVRLVYSEEFERVSDAYTREKQIQNWSRAKREALINGNHDLLPKLHEESFQ